MMNTPQTLGLKRSFGFGDRLGLATLGHLAAWRRVSGFAPIFAQQSIREMTRTQRTPGEVMAAAQSALDRAGFNDPWGADGDHLKTPEDVQRVAAAGFCFYTIDPSAFVNNATDRLDAAALADAVARLDAENAGHVTVHQHVAQVAVLDIDDRGHGVDDLLDRKSTRLNSSHT